jgi:hypothetical protein
MSYDGRSLRTRLDHQLGKAHLDELDALRQRLHVDDELERRLVSHVTVHDLDAEQPGDFLHQLLGVGVELLVVLVVRQLDGVGSPELRETLRLEAQLSHPLHHREAVQAGEDVRDGGHHTECHELVDSQFTSLALRRLAHQDEDIALETEQRPHLEDRGIHFVDRSRVGGVPGRLSGRHRRQEGRVRHRGALGGRLHIEDEDTVLDIDDGRIAGPDLPLGGLVAERVLDFLAQHRLDVGEVAFVGQCLVQDQLARRFQDFDGEVHASAVDALLQLGHFTHHHRLHLVTGQLFVDGNATQLVDAVAELRRSLVAQRLEHHILDLVAVQLLAAGTEADATDFFTLHIGHAQVAGADEDGVGEVDDLAVTERQLAVVHDAQEDQEDLGASLVQLVQKDNRDRHVRTTLEVLQVVVGELGVVVLLIGGDLVAVVASTLVVDVAAAGTLEVADRVLVHVLGHIDALIGLGVAVDEFGQELDRVGLAGARLARVDDEGDGLGAIAQRVEGVGVGVGQKVLAGLLTIEVGVQESAAAQGGCTGNRRVETTTDLARDGQLLERS